MGSMPIRILGIRVTFAIFMLIVLYTIGPILCVLLCTLIANTLGCQVDEGNVHPCNCLGVDIGGPLYALGMMGWFALITLPTGVLALIVYFAVLLVLKLTKKSDAAKD